MYTNFILNPSVLVDVLYIYLSACDSRDTVALRWKFRIEYNLAVPLRPWRLTTFSTEMHSIYIYTTLTLLHAAKKNQPNPTSPMLIKFFI